MVRVGRIAAVIAGAVLAAIAAPAAATGCSAAIAPDSLAERRITAEDLVRLRDIGAPDSSQLDMPTPLAVSPDGRTVAFVQSQGDPTSNSYCRQLLIVALDGRSAPRVLDGGGEYIMVSASVRGSLVPLGLAATVTPAWSPDGRTLGYLRRDRGVTQLWVVSAGGGEARPLTSSPVDIEQWAWASSDRVIVTSRPSQLAVRTANAAEGHQGWLYDARFSPQMAARPQMSGDVTREFATVDLGTGVTGPANEQDHALLANGSVGGAADDLGIGDGHGARVWVQPDDPSPLSPARLQFADADGRKTRCESTECAGGIVKLYWDEGSVIYLRREGWAKSELAFYRWRPSALAPTRLWRTSDVLLGCVLRLRRFLCARETSLSPRRIVEVDPAHRLTRTVYNPNPAFASLQLGSVERLTWRNALGLPAWGDLVLPPGHKSSSKLPLVVVQYRSLGFLRGGTGDEYPILPLAARGFAVLSIENPPSVAYALPNLKTWDEINRAGMKDWTDRRSMLSSILTGVGQVIARGIADPARIGITGVSDGATSARFALINSEVFSAAAISSSSLEPKTVMTYGGFAWADFNRSLGYPPASHDDPAFWRPASIALNARAINVPLLIQASDDEYLLSLETVTALREQGKPVELIVYPDEHHIKWQPAHRLSVYRRTIDWFAFWFLNSIDPDPAKAPAYRRWSAMRAQLAAGKKTEARSDRSSSP